MYIALMSVSTIFIPEHIQQMPAPFIIIPEHNELPELLKTHSTFQPKLSEPSLEALCSISPLLYLKHVKKKKSIKVHVTAKELRKVEAH